MRMLMIVYNEALDNELMEVLGDFKIQGYTKIPKVFGKGITSGAHLGTDIWPGLNNILYVACQEPDSKRLIQGIKDLRNKAGQEGIKAFVLPLDECT